MKKALIIAYYWPPAGGVEVMRVVKFCKYLQKLGWQPQILTVTPSRYGNWDESLFEEITDVASVIRTTSLEPHVIFNLLSGKSRVKTSHAKSAPSGQSHWQKKVALLGEYIRLNLFIPDARIGWYPFAVRAAGKAWHKQKPDLIFSTAPPYTVHLIARKLQQKWNCPWVADFRDPWLENYAYNTVPRLSLVKALNLKMEKSVLRAADGVICATPQQLTIQSSKVATANRHKFRVITNGYDMPPPRSLQRVDRFFLSYFGTLSLQRLPDALLPALQKACEENPQFARDFRFRVIGRIAPDVIQIIHKCLAPQNIELQGHMPLAQLTPLQQQEQAMLVLVDAVPFNNLIIPAKIFEILPTGNPILGIGPVMGDAAKLVEQYQGGTFCDPQNADEILLWIQEAYEHWKTQNLAQPPRRIPAMERSTQARTLATIFDDCLAKYSPKTLCGQTRNQQIF